MVAPAIKITSPVGGVDPLAGLTVAVTTVLPVAGKLAGLPETVVVVDMAVTFTITVAVASAKLPVAAKLAVMVSLPIGNFVPGTVRVMLGAAATDPSVVPPIANTTVPVGVAEPVAAVREAVSTRLAETAIVAALALRVIEVPVPVTVRVMEPDEARKVPVGT